MDYITDKGGRLYAHGLATVGRLGIGPSQAPLTAKQEKQIRAKGKKRGGRSATAYDDLLSDFSELPYEIFTLPSGEVVADAAARFTAMPRQVKVERVAKVSCGSAHCAAVTEDSKIYMWGLARHGRLGLTINKKLPFDAEDENDTYVSTPLELDFPGAHVKNISCGLKHTLAVDEKGVVYAWGLARYGRLGIGTFEHLPRESGDCTGFVDELSHHAATPVVVQGLQDILIEKVFAGAYNSFAIAGGVNGAPTAVYSWGLARYGLLGIGDFPTKTCWLTGGSSAKAEAEKCSLCKRTSQMKVPGVMSFVEEVRGHPAFSNCTITKPRESARLVALPSDPDDPFDVYCPFPVEVTAFRSQPVVDIALGSFHALAQTSVGHVFSWGLLRHGRCGLGEFDPDRWNPKTRKVEFDRHVPHYPRETQYVCTWKGEVKSEILDKTAFYQATPTRIALFTQEPIFQISANEYHNAAITRSGRLYTWGLARHGRLGQQFRGDKFLQDHEEPGVHYLPVPREVEATREVHPQPETRT